MKNVRFDTLPLSKEILKAIKDMGFEETTPIQSEAISPIMEGHDIIGQAETGTGKTAAFAIPLVERINQNSKNLQAVIICPTRELALQVSEEINKFVKYRKDIRFLPVYGGQPIDRQLNALKRGVHIVIGTPGRIMDHIERGTIKMNTVNMVVLDEADEMLDMGFREDIELILKNTPEERQTVLFSATMPKAILDLAKKFQHQPLHIKVTHEKMTVPGIEQIYFELSNSKKMQALSRVIDINNFKLTLVFCNTKRMVDELVENLQSYGYSADGLHGDMKQSTRDRVMAKFRDGKIEILVATDVAARGLDIENVEAVFNYDFPQDEEYYVHRIGRTGRAGKAGKAFTFVTGREMNKLRDIQKYTKAKIKLQQVPTYEDVEEVKIYAFLDKVKETLKKGKLKKYARFVADLTDEDYSMTDVAAALLKMNVLKNGDNDFSLSPDKKTPDKNSRSGKEFKRLFINVGKKDKIKPGDILGAVTGETGFKGEIVGAIDLFDKFSFIDVHPDYADRVVKALGTAQIKKKRIVIEFAEKK